MRRRFAGTIRSGAPAGRLPIARSAGGERSLSRHAQNMIGFASGRPRPDNRAKASAGFG